jgi:hypothetical protein
MFEDVEKNPGQGTSAPDALTPPRPAEDIFSGLENDSAGGEGGAGSKAGSMEKKSSGIPNALLVVLIFLIVAAVGVFIISKFLGFSKIDDFKKMLFSSFKQESAVNKNEEKSLSSEVEEIENIGDENKEANEDYQNENEPNSEDDFVLEEIPPLATSTAEEEAATSSESSSVLTDDSRDGVLGEEENSTSSDRSLIDTDGDGLSDKEERDVFKTDPANTDTDDDDLSDYDEVMVYSTDPNNSDTDSDSYLDGVEVQSGYDPKGEGKLNK